MRGLEMIKTIKEFMTVWLFITMMGVGLVTVAVLMPLLAVHKNDSCTTRLVVT